MFETAVYWVGGVILLYLLIRAGVDHYFDRKRQFVNELAEKAKGTHGEI